MAGCLGLLVAAFWVTDIGIRITAWATVIVAAATVVYAYLTLGALTEARSSSVAAREANELTGRLVEEFRRTREQASTPALRVTIKMVAHGSTMGQGSTAHGSLTNIGTSPAEKVRLVIHYGADHEQRVAEKGSLAVGEQLGFEANTSSYPNGAAECIFIAEFENLFSERFRSVTTFPLDPQKRVAATTDHGFENERVN